MFFQDQSILQFQKRMEDERKRSNMQTLFDMERVHEDTQMREVIDSVNGDVLLPVFRLKFQNKRN